jgi:hypothetical protein
MHAYTRPYLAFRRDSGLFFGLDDLNEGLLSFSRDPAVL